jgi:tRNA (cmo5U34)-methyltransferase
MDATNGWQTSEAAQRFKKVGTFMIPGRAEVLNTAAELTIIFSNGKGVVLDLGSGYGDATEAILGKLPEASVVLIDFSDEMIRLAAERFQGKSNIEVVKYNLNHGIPENLRQDFFDVVVSCFAIHHVELERRVSLFSQIQRVLKPGGIFINADRVAEESPIINEWMFDTWVNFMTEQVHHKLGSKVSSAQIKARQLETDTNFGDKPASIWAAEKDLRAAGFDKVDCLYKNQVVAIVVAIK